MISHNISVLTPLGGDPICRPIQDESLVHETARRTPPNGVEPLTNWLTARRSAGLSYGGTTVELMRHSLLIFYLALSLPSWSLCSVNGRSS